MSRPVSLGYLTPANGTVTAGPWTVTPAGGQALTTPDLVPNWQYTTDIEVSRTVSVDLAGLRDQCRLNPADEVHLSLTWAASLTGLQGAGPPALVRDGANDVTVSVPGTLAGGNLTVSVQLTLGRAAPEPRDRLAPHRPGSRLWTDEHRIGLEGDSTRFPTEALSFAAFQIHRPEVAWIVDLDTSDLEAPALSCARLLLNTDHPVYQRLTQTPPGPDAERSRCYLAYDVARQLVSAALATDELEPTDYPAGSIGQVLRARLTTYFGADGDDVAALRRRWLDRPGDLDAQLQAHFPM